MPKKQSKPAFKAILCDFGMVIADFDFRPAFRRMAKACPYSSAEIEAYFWQSGLEPLYDGGKMTSRAFYREVKKALRHRLDYEGFKHLWNGIFKPNPDVIRLLRTLGRRYRLVLISNTNAMHYEYLRRRFGVLRDFDRHILSFREKVRKPDLRIYRRAVKACRARPREIFYIDDRPDQTEAARSLGIEAFTFRKNSRDLRRRLEKLRIL